MITPEKARPSPWTSQRSQSVSKNQPGYALEHGQRPSHAPIIHVSENSMFRLLTSCSPSSPFLFYFHCLSDFFATFPMSMEKHMSIVSDADLGIAFVQLCRIDRTVCVLWFEKSLICRPLGSGCPGATCRILPFCCRVFVFCK